CRYLEITVYVPKSFGRELRGGFNFKRAGILRSHAPVGNVNMVDAPSGDHAGAELLASQPSRAGKYVCLGMYPVKGVINPGSGTQPHFVVQVFGNGHFLRIPAGRIARQPYLYGVKLPDTTVAYQLTGFFEL